MRYSASDKTRDYPAGRAIALAGSADAGKTRRSQVVLLPLV